MMKKMSSRVVALVLGASAVAVDAFAAVPCGHVVSSMRCSTVTAVAVTAEKKSIWGKLSGYVHREFMFMHRSHLMHRSDVHASL